MNGILNEFTYEPCKIGYSYKDNQLLLSKWFLVGGTMDNGGTDLELKQKYEFKNIREPADNRLYGTDNGETFYNLFLP